MDNPLDRLEVHNYSVTVEGDAFYIVGQIMSVDLLPEAVLRANIKKTIGKEVRLEHAIIEVEPYAMVGEVVDVWWDEKVNAPFGKAQIYNDTEVERQLRKDLLDDQKKPNAERKYKGFSIGILNSRDKVTKQSTKIFPRELTITGDPVCKECTIAYVGEYSNMSAKDIETAKEVLQQEFKRQVDEMKKTYEKQVSESSGAVSILTEKFNAATKDLDTFKNQLKSKDDEILKLKEAKRVAEIEPLVFSLLEVSQHSKDSEIYKSKKEKWMKLDKDVLLEMAEMMKRTTELYGQSTPVLGGMQSLPIESGGKVADNGSGLITMDAKLARSILR